MPNRIPIRQTLHAPAVENRNGPDTIHYTLRDVPQPKGSKWKKRISAKVIEKQSIHAGDFARHIAEQYPNLQESLVHFVLQAAANVLLDELKQGHRVTMNGVLSMGLSLKGTVDPKKPLDAKKLTLTPTARFSQNFITALNKGAQLAYEPSRDSTEG